MRRKSASRRHTCLLTENELRNGNKGSNISKSSSSRAVSETLKEKTIGSARKWNCKTSLKTSSTTYRRKPRTSSITGSASKILTI